MLIFYYNPVSDSYESGLFYLMEDYMSINRDNVLIARAVKAEELSGNITFDVDYEESAVERVFGEDNDYVVLRSESDIISVYLVDDWQVHKVDPENWPDYLLDEAEQV